MMLSRGIASVELALNFGVEVVAGILGLPVAARHSQAVLDRTVWNDIVGGAQFGNEHEALAVFPAVGIQAVLEGGPDALLVVRAAELD